MTPASATAMRAALESRINSRAADEGVDSARVRRRLVFQRVMRRLAVDETWVLKGGYLLEARLGRGARTTRDLDLATAVAADSGLLRGSLEALLAVDVDNDFFRFTVSRLVRFGAAGGDGAGWRVSLTASLAGRPFDHVRLDVVPRTAEVMGGIETIDIPPPVAGLELGTTRVLAADVAQHAAEKFHALCRTYAGGRPSTRVKDLVDIVLLVDVGLLPHPELGERLQAVFTVRDGGVPPHGLPAPPASWDRDYSTLSADTAATIHNLAAAFALADATYRRALAENDEEKP